MMDAKNREKMEEKQGTPKPVVLPKGAIELQPGVYLMPEVRSAFSALSAKLPKTVKP
jgi:hypothetical protein